MTAQPLINRSAVRPAPDASVAGAVSTVSPGASEANDIHLSVIIPTWNGGERLPETLSSIARFAWEQPFSVERIVIDDCSDPGTVKILTEWQRNDPTLRVVRNAVNSGKGFSVARGMALAQGKYRVFLDSDLAYPAEEITKILHRLEHGADVAIATRTDPRSRYLMSPAYFHYLYTRHLMSRIFNLMVRLTLLPGIADTQAGLKGFTAQAADLIFPQLSIPRFGFDLECLFIARQHAMTIAQTPVEFHYNNEPSTVHFVRDVIAMLRDIALVRWHGWRHFYV